jgi:hypothetical protein
VAPRRYADLRPCLADAQPTAFKDIGKLCSDLLSKDYKVGTNTVEVKSKVPNGVVSRACPVPAAAAARACMQPIACSEEC